MSDRYQGFTTTPIGKLLVKNLGLPNPTEAGAVRRGRTARRRHRPGRRPRPARRVAARPARPPRHRLDRRTTRTARRYKGLVFDATGLQDLRRSGPTPRSFFTPVLRSVGSCARVVVIGTPPEQVKGAERVAQRALEGFTRWLGKEIGRGRTVQLVYVGEGAEASDDPGLPPLPQVGLRLGPGGPVGAHHTTKAPRSPTGPGHSPARSRWSPAPAAASASRSPACCTEMARRSSVSTYPRRPASSRR